MQDTTIQDLAEYYGRLSASLNNALECQDYDDVEVLVDRIEECELEAAKRGYVLSSEMEDDGSYKATWNFKKHFISIEKTIE